MATAHPRWEGDQEGHGIADGSWIAPSVVELHEMLQAPDWVADDPEAHILPHLVRACAAARSPWRLEATALRDGVFAVDLQWTAGPVSRREVRAAVYALIGAIAEGTTFIRQVAEGDGLAYHVTTGLLPGDTHFASHGHLLCVRIGGVA